MRSCVISPVCSLVSASPSLFTSLLSRDTHQAPLDHHVRISPPLVHIPTPPSSVFLFNCRGFVVSVVRDLALPVKFIGVGEKIDDLRDFQPELFVDALLGNDEATSARMRARVDKMFNFAGDGGSSGGMADARGATSASTSTADSSARLRASFERNNVGAGNDDDDDEEEDDSKATAGKPKRAKRPKPQSSKKKAKKDK